MNNPDLLKELTAMVAKSMPHLQAQEFAEFVKQSNDNKVRLLSLESELTKSRELIIMLERERTLWATAKETMDKANATLQIAETKERNLQIETLKYQLKCEQEKTQHSAGILAMIAKNPRAIEIMNHSLSQNQGSYPGQNGNMIYPAPINKTETKITESLETKREGTLMGPTSDLAD